MNKVIFLLIHIGALLGLYVGATWTAILLCVACYLVRMFAITAGYHRLFSHRSYKTSRPFQFVLGFLGATAAQKGPLWWAASHRHHHQHSDTEDDIHSPHTQGFWWAHVGWVMSEVQDEADMGLVKDLTHLPELRLLEHYHFVPPLMFLGLIGALGWVLHSLFPEAGTPMQHLTWGAFMSTVLLYHGTFSINSLAHLLGRRRYETKDQSRNSFLLALITLGEGWHNNHHRYPSSERQGFYWWELDVSHLVLRLCEMLGLVWDLKRPPASAFR